MSYEITLKKQVSKFLDKLEKSAPSEHSKIVIFLNENYQQVIILAYYQTQRIYRAITTIAIGGESAIIAL